MQERFSDNKKIILRELIMLFISNFVEGEKESKEKTFLMAT